MTFMIAELIQFFFLQIILTRVTRILKFFSKLKFFIDNRLGFFSEHSKIHVSSNTHDSKLSKSHLSFTNKNVNEDGSIRRDEVESLMADSKLSKSHLSFTNKNANEDGSIRRDEVESLMADLGVLCHFEGEKLPEVLNSNDLFDIFEVEQPRLDEVKEAFDVFDENKDGFIDARELQIVLSILGLKERADIDDCKNMIRAFDENADGRIDFDEFVKFMESTLC